MGERDQCVVDRVAPEVDKARFQRPVLLDRPFAGETPVDVIVGAEHGGDAGEDLGFVTLDPPAASRATSCWLTPLPALREEDLLVDLGPKLIDFGAAARVALLNAWAQKAAGGNRAARPPAAFRPHRPRPHPPGKRRSCA